MIYDHKEGVSFRKVSFDDLKNLTALKHESWWGTHKTLMVNEQDQEHWFRNIPSDSLFLVGHWGDQFGGVVAYTNIDPISRTCDISGTATKELRGDFPFSGFKAGTDFAFEMLNLHRLNAEVLETNFASLKIEIGTLGFQYEGRKRKAVYKCGKYYDSIVLGLLREDWEKQPRVLSYGGCCNHNFNADRAQRCIQLTNRTLNENSNSLVLLQSTSPCP